MPPAMGDDARSDAEDEAFETLLHAPLTTADGRIAYALAVIEREIGFRRTRNDPPFGRDDPLPVAYRNLRFGEYAGEKVQPEAAAPDPAFEAVRHRLAARAARDAYADESEGSDTLSDRETAARDRMLATQPTTLAGLLALVRDRRRGQCARADDALAENSGR